MWIKSGHFRGAWLNFDCNRASELDVLSNNAGDAKLSLFIRVVATTASWPINSFAGVILAFPRPTVNPLDPQAQHVHLLGSRPLLLLLVVGEEIPQHFELR